MSARLLLVCIALSALWPLSACKRACESPANCVRTCSCLNEETNLRLDCDVAFRCEGDTQACEPAHDEKSCDELCADYAGNGRCGVQRCVSDAECSRSLSCPLVDANGTPTGQFADCAIQFACEQAFESCDPRATVDDASLCANECASAAP